MRLRPCIDIHNGRVKQIVGGSLRDGSGSSNAEENFVAVKDADYYGGLYKKLGLCGGHIVILNKPGTDEYQQSKRQAGLALEAFPGGLQIGGGVSDDNAEEWIRAGASHCIFTSFLFENGTLNQYRLDSVIERIGSEKIVIDLSCRYKNDCYYVVTDRWQTFTELEVNEKTLDSLRSSCDEFLIHGVDVEGKQQGVDRHLLEILGRCDGVKITYAGGIRSLEDIELIREAGQEKIDYTVGSALDIFGGSLSLTELASL